MFSHFQCWWPLSEIPNFIVSWVLSWPALKIFSQRNPSPKAHKHLKQVQTKLKRKIWHAQCLWRTKISSLDTLCLASLLHKVGPWILLLWFVVGIVFVQHLDAGIQQNLLDFWLATMHWLSRLVTDVPFHVWHHHYFRKVATCGKWCHV